MSERLAAVIAAALQAECTIDEQRIRAIVREELDSLGIRSTTRSTDWYTPPKAAHALGVSLKRVRGAMATGRVESRPRGFGPPRQRAKLEVRLSSLEQTLRGDTTRVTDAPDITEWAARRRSGNKS